MAKKKTAFELLKEGNLEDIKAEADKASQNMEERTKKELKKAETELEELKAYDRGKPTICRVRKDFHTMAKKKARKRRMTLQSYLEYLIEIDEP